MTDKEFDAYVDQLMAHAQGKMSPGDPADYQEHARLLVTNLLQEFQEKAYIAGREALIDKIRSELDSFDIRRRPKPKRLDKQPRQRPAE